MVWLGEMKSRYYWHNRIVALGEELGLNGEFKLVFGKWDTLFGLNTAFLSLNPGLRPNSGNETPIEQVVAESLGNTYELEAHLGIPYTKQFLCLMDFLRLRPSQVLSGVVVPFRSANWEEFSNEQIVGLTDFGREFWMEPLQASSVRHIIVNAVVVENLVFPSSSKNTILSPNSEYSSADFWGF